MEIIRTIVESYKYEYDGILYDTMAEARAAERVVLQRDDPILRYGNPGFIKAHGLETIGTYLIYDEGPVDYGANASPTLLAVLHGTLRNAITSAFAIPGFVGYGPGVVMPVNVVEV